MPLRARFVPGRPLLAAVALSGCLLLAALSGCQSLSTQSPSTNALLDPLMTDHPSKNPVQSTPPISQGLDSSGLTLLLQGELAGQRGQYERASQAYLAASRRYQHPDMAERATYMAHLSGSSEQLLETARFWAKLAPSQLSSRQILADITRQQGNFLESLEQRLAITREGQPSGLVDLIKSAIDSAAALERLARPLNDFLASRRSDAAPTDRSPPDSVTAMDDALLAAALLQSEILRLQGPLDSLPAPERADQQAALSRLDATSQAALQTPDFWLIKARLELDAGHLEAARMAAQNGAERAADDSRFTRLLLQANLRAGHLNAAQQQVNQLLSANTDSGPLRIALARIFLAEGYRVQATDLLAPMLSPNGLAELDQRNQARLILGEIAQQENAPDRALRHYHQLEPGNGFMLGHRQAATMLLAQQGLETARTWINSQIARHPETTEAFELMEIQWLTAQGDVELADRRLEQGLQRSPTSPQLLYQRALRLVDKGDLEGMERTFQRILKQTPDNAPALNALGYVLADRQVPGRLDDARTYIERANQLAPQTPSIMDSMGWVLFRQGHLEQALKWLDHAHVMMPDQEITAHLAEVLHALSRTEQARLLIKDTLEKGVPAPAIEALLKRLPALTP